MLAPTFAPPKSEKYLEWVEKPTETLATQAIEAAMLDLQNLRGAGRTFYSPSKMAAIAFAHPPPPPNTLVLQATDHRVYSL